MLSEPWCLQGRSLRAAILKALDPRKLFVNLFLAILNYFNISSFIFILHYHIIMSLYCLFFFSVKDVHVLKDAEEAWRECPRLL